MEKKHALAYAAALNAVFLAAALAAFRPWFLLNDDLILRLFVDGSLGFQTLRAVYLNPLAAGLLVLLYRLAPALPWYGLVQYALLFASFTALSRLLLCRMKTGPALLLSLALLVFFGLDAYILMQYTKTAAAASVGGVSLLLGLWEEERPRPGAAVCGVVLALFGALYRYMIFFACGLILCWAALDLLLRLRRAGTAGFSREFFRRLRPLLLLVALAAAAVGAERFLPLPGDGADWAYYREFNALRTELLDFHLPDFEAHRAEYEALGIPETFYRQIEGFEYYDTERFDLDTLRAIRDMDPEACADADPARFVTQSLRAFLGEWSFAGLVLIALVWLLFGRHDAGAWLSALGAGLCFLAVAYLLFRQGRYNMEHVDYGLLLAFAAALARCVPGGRPGRERLLAAAVLVLTAALLARYLSYAGGMYPRRFARENGADYAAQTQAAALLRREDRLVLYDLAWLDWRSLGGPLARTPEGLFDHMVMLGGWQANHPAVRRILASYGVENPYRDMIGSERVCLATSHVERILACLRELYAPDARAELLYPLGDAAGTCVYRILPS